MTIKITSFIIIFAYLITSTGCTTCQKVPINTAQEIEAVHVDPEKNYNIEFTTGKNYHVKGHDLAIQNGLLGIRFEDKGDYRFYQPRQINALCAEEKSKSKTRLAIILGIVGGIIVAGGILTAITFAALRKAEN